MAPSGQTCGCGAALSSEQRYCLSCGARTGHGDARRREAFGHAQPAPAAAASPPARVRIPGARGDLPIGAATAIFAMVLGTSAWAGARVTAAPLPPAPIYAYAPAGAPAPASLPPATPAASVPDAGDLSAGDDSVLTAGDDSLAGAAADPVATPAAATAPASEQPAEDDASDDEPATDGDAAPPAIAPTLDRVVVIALPPLPYDAIADPAGPSPYLAGELASRGTVLRGFTATAPSALASRVALLTGQAPNPATLESCPAAVPMAPGTLGDDDQAAGAGCLYSADVFAAGDLLASSDRDWRVYAAAEQAASCEALPAGAPWPAERPVPLLLGAFTAQPGCASRLAPLSQLAADLQSKTGPALSYVQLDTADGPSTDAALRELMPAVLGALKDVDASAVLLLPSASTQAGGEVDRSACCERPWVADQATGGGGRTGALVISPAAQPGAVIDGAIDHYDALKTVSVALGVRPLGYAAREEVTGFPAELWQQP